MAEIIDFSKYKKEIESASDSLSAVLKEKGTDDGLAQHADSIAKAIYKQLGSLGQYNLVISLPGSLSVEEQQGVVSEVKAQIDQRSMHALVPSGEPSMHISPR